MIGIIKKVLLIAIFVFSNSLIAQVDRSVMPESGPAPEIKFGTPKTFLLDNGLTVMVVENSKLPRASATLSFNNPLIFEGEIAGVSAVLGGMLGNGTNSIAKDDFNEEIDYMGATLSVSGTGVFASSLSRYFDRVLELMAGSVLEPLLTQEEFERQRDLLKESLKTADKDVATAADRVENLLTYGAKHPNGEFISQESIDKITLNDVKDFFENYSKSTNAFLVIIGDVEFEDIKSKVTSLFDGWEAGEVIASPYPTPTNPEKSEIIFVDMPNATQSVVSIINTIDFNKKESDYFAALVANRILGGGGSGRLFNNLREDKGWTYGSYSGINESYKTKGAVIAQAQVRNEVTDSSAVELLKEIDKMRNTLVTDEELQNAKAKYTGNFVLSLENASTVASFARNIITQDLTEDYYNTFLSNIDKVSKEDVQKASQKYFQTNTTRIFITGKGSEILESLENIEYNGDKLTVRYFDNFGNETARPDYSVDDSVTVAGVIDNYITAIGGLDKLKEVSSIESKFTANIQGTPLEGYSLKNDKNQSVFRITVMGQVMQKTVFNKYQGYNEVMGQKINISEDELEIAIIQSALFTETNLDYSAIELVGTSVVNDEEVYEVKITDNISAFYSKISGLKLKEVTTLEVQGNAISNEVYFEDYQEVDGILFPGVQRILVGPQEIKFKVTSTKLNVQTSDSDFE